MNTLSFKIGYWSSIILAFTFIAWIICFTGIALTAPLFFWSDISAYSVFVKSHSQLFQNTAKVFMLLFSPVYVILINSYYDYAPENKKVLARLSLAFASGFAILSCIHYFIQLSVVRLNIAHGQITGLENFVQANPNSIMTAIDMLGWTLFLGLSSFFIYPIFENTRLNRIIKYAFVVNGISCFFAGIGYIFQIDILTFACINLGVGGAILTISIASIKLFKLMKSNKEV